jgi:hypothetical protein
MPRGRKLNTPPVILDMDDVRRWFTENDTRCETAEHPLLDAPHAVTYYQTEWSFAFLCEDCNDFFTSMDPATRLEWDGRLADHMYSIMLRRSYVQTNITSGFVLEEIVAQRAQTVREIEKLDGTQRAFEQREIRKHIRESTVKVGMADDEILTARQRQDKRQQAGVPRIGPARIDRGSVLRARLLPPALPKEQEGA